MVGADVNQFIGIMEAADNVHLKLPEKRSQELFFRTSNSCQVHSGY